VDCVDGDPCDRDGECGNGFCAFRIRLCVNQNDPNIPVCKPPRSGLRSIHVVPPQFSALAKGMDLRKSSCGDFVDVAVPTHRDGIHPDRPGRVRLRVVARAPGANPPTDGDTLMLVCRPRPANRPCP